jgi:hypothetical protein
VSTVGSTAERVEAAIVATKRLNPTLNAYLHLDLEGARAEAAEFDALEAAGVAPGPLAGMPVCIKDIVDVAGMPTTAGGADWMRHPDEDATVVARLRAAGAVVVGKGNTNEFACGIDGRNPHKGDCHNPWDPARLSGGSSSGPAAAVAAGMAAGGVGSDTSGSIRVPAALCGVVGIRPTRGLVPADGVVPLAWSLDSVGPLAADVASAALLLDVLAGRPPAPAPRPEVAGLRLGVAMSLMDLAEEPVAEAIDAAIAGLREAGAEIVDCALPHLGRATAIHRIVQASEVAAAHAPWFQRQRAQPARLPDRHGPRRGARGPAGRPAADRPTGLRGAPAAGRRGGRVERRANPPAVLVGSKLSMRLLVLTDDPSADTKLHEPLEEIAAGEELEVKVVAPIRPESTLDLVTGDLDDAKADAEERAESTAKESKEAEVVTRADATVGDADQLLALGDALAEFEADHIVLVDPDDEGLAAAARGRFGLPVTELSAG